MSMQERKTISNIYTIKKCLYSLSLLLLALLVLAGCQRLPPESPSTDIEGTYDLPTQIDFGRLIERKEFTSREELESFLTSFGDTQSHMPLKNARSVMPADGMAESIAVDSGQSAPEYSGTNVQVETVDEADILKTDGTYIYTVTDSTLFIIQAYPGEEAKVVSSLSFKDRPRGLFVRGETLAIFGDTRDNSFFTEHDIRPADGMTYVHIYDISDKADPTLIEEYHLEGRYFRGRMKEDRHMYLLTTNRPYPQSPLPIIMRGGQVNHIPLSNIHYFTVPYQDPIFV
ncbi:MAG: beta-propeller domain-containing protein, partial [Nanoarchaeota archaeon]